ncbi:MAG: DUF962 domain-containing protein [Rhizobacter sp.]|nr:DUF962 domain-containing protein [Bacteriovorax sp.]
MKTFKEFWPYYLNEHSNQTNRRLHFVGTFIVHLIVIFIIVTARWKMLWIVPLVGYTFAWVGHFIVEQNRPATFKHPVWSLMGDFKMFYMMLFRKKPN